MSTKIKDRQTRTAILSPEEGKAFFEDAILELLGISGEEFLRRYDTGEYADLPDTPENWDIIEATMLIPFGRSGT